MAAVEQSVGGLPIAPLTARKSFTDVLGARSLPSSSSSEIHPLDQDPLKLGLHKGQPAAFFSDAQLSGLSTQYSWTLVGKFSQGYNRQNPKLGCPSLESLHAYFLSLDFKGEFSLGLLDNRHVLIHLSNELDYLRLYSRMVWFIGSVTMRVFRWSPYFRVDKESSLVPAWITMPRLPIILFEQRSLFALASLIGRPLRRDEATMQLKRPSVSQVQVEVDLLKTLPEQIWIGLGDSDGYWQNIEYEALPGYCQHCFHVGHRVEDCHVQNPSLKVLEPKQDKGKAPAQMKQKYVPKLPQPAQIGLASSAAAVVIPTVVPSSHPVPTGPASAHTAPAPTMPVPEPVPNGPASSAPTAPVPYGPVPNVPAPTVPVPTMPVVSAPTLEAAQTFRQRDANNALVAPSASPVDLVVNEVLIDSDPEIDEVISVHGPEVDEVVSKEPVHSAIAEGTPNTLVQYTVPVEKAFQTILHTVSGHEPEDTANQAVQHAQKALPVFSLHGLEAQEIGFGPPKIQVVRDDDTFEGIEVPLGQLLEETQHEGMHYAQQSEIFEVISRNPVVFGVDSSSGGEDDLQIRLELNPEKWVQHDTNIQSAPAFRIPLPHDDVIVGLRPGSKALRMAHIFRSCDYFGPRGNATEDDFEPDDDIEPPMPLVEGLDAQDIEPPNPDNNLALAAAGMDGSENTDTQEETLIEVNVAEGGFNDDFQMVKSKKRGRGRPRKNKH